MQKTEVILIEICCDICGDSTPDNIRFDEKTGQIIATCQEHNHNPDGHQYL